MTKRVLIVGGNTGIGAALNEQLLAEGVETILISRNQGGVDVLDDEPNFPVIDGAIDALVYCPGSINLKPFRGLKISDFQHDMDVNYFGAVKTIKNYLPNLKESKDASIVLFSTVAVQKGMPFHSSIAGAKGAVEGLTRALAAELAPSIRVNCVAPSLTDTPLAEKLLRNEKQREGAEQRHPLKAIGEAVDVAHMANFLISDKARWMSGQIIGVDGGMSSLSN
ncbi:MAG: 3-oxoacyl-[acyl-carrier protein] reductase [Bacteroidia bacterium]|jgi:NAD(P)-dependent dehydrogenase (short-subunit alcohol dehydrogenase family)|nr:SDR family oxidoreductase [Bacteroidia bacterium]MDC0104840.1 SDR family oxidoreductase [Bacteroidia bacterium]